MHVFANKGSNVDFTRDMGSENAIIATDNFYAIALSTLDEFYSERSLAVTNNEPFLKTASCSKVD